MAGTVSIDITASNSKALAAINQTNQALGGMGKAAQQSATSLGNIEKGLAWAGKITAIAAGGAAITAAIRKVSDAASDLQQSEGAVEAVFGDMSGAVEQIQAAAEAANDLGLSTAEFNQTAAQMGGMLKNLGIESNAVAGVTTDLIGLSADLAAVFGTDLAQATGAVQAALRGEFDPLEKFSVSLKKTTVDAYAAANGISSAAATIELLKQQSADYAGQRESEAGTFAVAEEKMQAALQDTYAVIGGALLPAMTSLTQAVGVLASAFGSIPAPVLDFAAKIAMIAAAGKLLLFITPKLVGAFRALGAALLSTVSPAAAIATSMDGKLTPAMERAEKRAKAMRGALKQVGVALAIMAAYKTVEFLNDAMEEAVGTTEEWAKAWADLNAASRGSSLADQVEEVANLSRQGDFGLKQQALGLRETQGLFESATLAQKDFWQLTTAEGPTALLRWKDAGSQIEAAKDGLVELAATNPQAAVQQWRALEAVFQGAGMDPATYQETKDAIEEAARAAGYSADAFSENATKLDELRTAYDEASKATKNFKSDMDALFADLDVDVAVAKYKKELQEIAKTDFRGLSKPEAIAQINSGWRSVEESLIQAGASTEELGAKYDQMKRQAERALRGVGIEGEEAAAIIERAFGDEELVKARWAGQDAVDEGQDAIDGMEQGTPPPIQVNTGPAMNKLNELVGRLTNIGKQAFTATIGVVIEGLGSLPNKVREWLGRSAPLPPDPADDVVGIMAASTRAKKKSGGKGGADVTVVVGVEFDVDQTRALAGLSQSWEDVTDQVADYEQAVNNLSDTTGRIRELSQELKGAKGDDKKAISKDLKEAAREAFNLAKGLGLAEGKAKKFVAQINKASGKQALKLFDALEASFRKTKKAADQARAVFAGWQQIADSVAGTFEQAFNPGAALSKLKSDLAQTATDTKTAYEDAVAARDDLLDDSRRTSWNPFERQAWQQDFNALQAAVKTAQKAQTSSKVDGSKLSAELKKQAAQAKQFAARLQQLKGAGLSGESLQELAGMGVEAGNEFAAALLDPLTGPQLRAAMNETQAAIAQAGKTAGKAVADANLAAVRQGIKDAAELERKWFKKNPLQIETKLNIKLSRKQKKALKKLGVDVSGMAAPPPAQVTINVTADGDGEAIAAKVEQAWRSIERRERGMVLS